MSSCYSSWATAKTGQSIPCFNDNKPSASLYNPQKEAETFAELECFCGAGFILIAGFGCGLHITELIKKYSHIRLIVVEANCESIEFLVDSKKVTIPSNITVCTPDTLYDTLVKQYYPLLCGAFCFSPLRSWANANPAALEDIQRIIQNALKTISADISVQSHFGKLWHRNILQNLVACENIAQNHLLNFENTSFPTRKTAFVAGAGPSLDLWFEELQENKDKYYIIATDTAYHALIQHDIIPDVAVSVDAQHISLNHFLCEKNNQTLFAFDLCANPASVQNIVKQKKTVFFFKNEHPLCVLADEWYYSQLQNKTGEISQPHKSIYGFFPYFSSGNGTVLLAALNFARFAGFTTIKTGGADFAYLNGKPYAQGTYLDAIYGAKSTKLIPAESQFCALMFRTELEKLDNQNGFTTPLLQQYKLSFENFFSNLTTQQNVKSNTFSPVFCTKNFPAQEFIHWYRENIMKLMEDVEKSTNTAILQSLLPYGAWYSHKTSKQREIIKILELGLRQLYKFNFY